MSTWVTAAVGSPVPPRGGRTAVDVSVRGWLRKLPDGRFTTCL
ncbi:hypothetical protein [Streptomyces sp. GbtcB6]|nr:hypothetical protein [Streptomyces sp. GbtcB6]